MDIESFCKELEAKSKDLDKLAKRSLPVKVGAIARRHYQDNFRQGGFVNNGLKPWQRSKRQSSKSKDAAYGTLLSRERNLFKGLTYITGDYRAKVYNNLPYASIHNWGGIVHPQVTPKMRRFAWAKYFQSTGTPPKRINGLMAGKNGKKRTMPGARMNEEANMWKRLALTKKKRGCLKVPCL